MKKSLFIATFSTVLFLAACGGQTSGTATTNDLGTTSSELTATEEAELPPLEPIPTGDNELLGNWQSDCLVPDPNSDWAERHSFKIDSTYAVQSREEWYAPNCSGSGATKTTTFRYTIPTKGEINLTDSESGMTMYDSYSVSGNTLRFGHGFRNTEIYLGPFGASETERFTSLNNYILYKK